jgi:hypothetical protein
LNARVFKVKYKKLIIFDDENMTGLPVPIKENEDFIVLDWMIAKSCEKHKHNFLEDTTDLVREVHFYPTKRVDGYCPDIKDLVTVSYLNKDQLSDFEYSDTYAKFKMMHMLKELNLRGRKNGKNHRALKLEVEKREIRKAKMNLYKDSKHLKFKYEMPKEIKNDYLHTPQKLNYSFEGIM